MNIIGKKIAILVNVDAIIAFDTSSILSDRLCLNILSITTIASSTTIPTAITSELNVTIFKVSPVKYSNAIEPIIDVGIATDITKDALKLFKNKSIIPNAMTELRTMFNITSFIDALIYDDSSYATVSLNCSFSLFN